MAGRKKTEAVETLVNEKVVLKQIAALAAAGAGPDAIKKELGVSDYIYKLLTTSDEFKTALEEIGNEATVKAIQLARTQISNLVSKAIRVLNQKLDEGELDAAKEVFKRIGMDGSNDKPVADTNIQIVLPGSVDNAIEVKSDVQEESRSED